MLQLLDTDVDDICCLYSTKGEVSHKFKKHGVEAAKNVGINKAEIKMAAR